MIKIVAEAFGFGCGMMVTLGFTKLLFDTKCWQFPLPSSCHQNQVGIMWMIHVGIMWIKQKHKKNLLNSSQQHLVSKGPISNWTTSKSTSLCLGLKCFWSNLSCSGGATIFVRMNQILSDELCQCQARFFGSVCKSFDWQGQHNG